MLTRQGLKRQGRLGCQSFDQMPGIKGRAHLFVVVKVAEHVSRRTSSRRLLEEFMCVAWLATSRPGFNTLSPAVQRRIAVLATIKRFGSMQPQVDKIRGQVFHIWPVHDGIRHHQCSAIFAQQFQKRFIAKAGVADFNGMPQVALAAGRQAGALDVRVIFFASAAAASVSLGSCFRRVSKTSGLKGMLGGNCRRMGPSLARRLKRSDAKKNCQSHRYAFAFQPEHVGDVAWAFDAEAEGFRRGVMPVLVARRCLQP